jgi:DNA mismatch endonuclease (patch repair protein)
VASTQRKAKATTKMTDNVDPATRSRVMAQVKSADTSPELFVRQALHSAGFRYRLHDLKLPGKPDIVLPRYRMAVFVNGCFWHGHDCERFRRPNSNREYWDRKIERNRARDKAVRAALRRDGWKTRVVWECQLQTQTKALITGLERLRAGWSI